MPIDSDIERLIGLLDGISAMLLEFGETRWAGWISTGADRLRKGDGAGLEHFLQAFGGMGGSINDLYICPQNGHRVSEADVVKANERLSRALSEAWKLAKDLARENG